MRHVVVVDWRLTDYDADKDSFIQIMKFDVIDTESP